MIELNVEEAKTIWQKIRGLIGSDSQQSLLIKTRWGIHTFFMNHPIDVIVLSEENRVIKLKENLEPNKFFVWHPRYRTIIELSVGTIRKRKIHINTPVTFRIQSN